MNQIQRHHLNAVVWVGLWGLCGLSHALGLGPVGSRVTMGEGLSLTVPVRLEPGESLASDCVSAKVHFGEDKVSAFQVDVNLLQGSQGPYAVQVSTTPVVSEPVVTVQVAVGCAARVTRTYVLMAEAPGSPVPRPHAVEASVQAGQGGKPAAAPLQTSVRGERAHRGDAHARRQAPSGEAWPIGGDPELSMRVSAPSAQATPRGRSTPLALPAPADTAPRLVLSGMRMASALDVTRLVDDHKPELKAQRASAAAHWWALQATPGQMALEQARLQDLERRVAELQNGPSAASAVVGAASGAASQALAEGVTEALAVGAADAASGAASDLAPAGAAAADVAAEAEHEAGQEAASTPAAAHRPAPDLSVDPVEVRQIRIVGLAIVALIGLLAWGYQHWRRSGSSAKGLAPAASDQPFAVPPSWLQGRR